MVQKSVVYILDTYLILYSNIVFLPFISLSPHFLVLNFVVCHIGVRTQATFSSFVNVVGHNDKINTYLHTYFN